jgi:hypothetical protein
MNTLNIGKDFSGDPAGRYRSDGGANGEKFREDFLKPKLLELAEGQQLNIILDDDVESYGSSFLTEGFAGMVKYGYMQRHELINKLVFTYSDEDFEFYENKVLQYINEANFNSSAYTPTQPPKE